MHKHGKFHQKGFAWFSILSLVLQIGSGIFLYNPVIAQEATPTPTQTIAPTDTPTPTDQVTTTPSVEPSPTPTIESSETSTPTPQPTATPEVSTSPSPTPQVSPIPPPAGGELAAVVLPDTSASSVASLDLNPVDVTTSASLITNKADYAPTDTAVISGTGLKVNTIYILVISSTDAPAVNFQTNVTTDSSGGFVYAYQLDGIYRPNYKVELKDSSGSIVATTTFTDAKPTNTTSVIDFSQCANGTGTDTGCPGGWINGILQSSNSHYQEDQSVPQRLVLSVDSGETTRRTITFRYEARKNGIHAYDSMTTWDLTQTTADQCQGLAAGDCVGGGSSTMAVPLDSTVVNPFTSVSGVTSTHQIAGDLVMYGGTITNISAPTHDNAAVSTGDDFASVTITYTSASVPGKIMLLWGGHTAASTGPRGWGVGLGSSNVSGGPYHFKLDSTDSTSIGSRDNQIQGASFQTTPVISTTPNLGSGNIGVTLNDSANLSGGNSPTGSITFKLFSPSDPTCSGTAAFTNVVSVSSNNTYNTSSGFTSNATGTWHWTATYSGDSNNTSVSSSCADEPVTVNKVSPSISTTPSAGGVVGVTLNDTATLTGGYSPTGTVTFTLYPPSDSTCAGAASYTDADGSAPYDTSSSGGGFASNAVGTWHWKAAYGGDSNNNPVTSACADETVTTTKATPTLTTTASGPVTVGDNINDVAHLSGGFGSLGGNITFDVFAPGDTTCTTPISVPPSQSVSGTGDYTSGNYATSAVGDYRWIAHYSGDANNKSVDTACNDSNESSATNKATPEISTTPSGGGVVGIKIHDIANITGGFNPTGTVTFNLYDVSDSSCASTPVFSDPNKPLSSSTATSGDFTTAKAGIYHWKATYNGDSNNNSVTSACSAEAVTIEKASPSISTDIHDPNHYVVTSVDAGSTVHDKATVSGGFSPSGNIDFTFYNNGSCNEGGTGAGSVALSSGIADPSSSEGPLNAGSYSFKAHYEGDGNNNPADSSCESLVVKKIDSTTVTAIHNDNNHSTDVQNTTIALGSTIHDQTTVSGGFGTPSGTATFQYWTNGTCNSTPTDTSGALTLSGGTVDATGFVKGPLAAGDYSFMAAYSGDNNYNGSTGPCEKVTVGKADLDISTVIHDAGHNPVTSVPLGSVVHDTATVAGQVDSIVPTGPVTFQFFTSGDCTTGGSPVANTGTDGGAVRSADSAALAAGGYSYQATIAGDSNYNGTTSACEPLTVNKATPTAVTEVHNSTGGVITTETLDPNMHDKATVTGVGGFVPTGTVDFTFYPNDTCANTGTAAGNIALDGSGVAHPSNTETLTSAGSYSFKAHYNGDTNYVAADSTCEPFTYTTITINKLANGVGTFTYAVTGPTNATPSLTTTNGSTGSVTTAVLSGSYTVGENNPSPFLFVSLSCAGAPPSSPADRISPSFSAPVGQNTVCNFENTKQLATRTQGFWATHTAFSNNLWTNNVVPTGEANMNTWGGTCTGNIDADASSGTNELMGGFWANIANKSPNGKRSDIDKARMQLLQQLEAALLNRYGLGTADGGIIDTAENVYCTGTAAQIIGQVGILGNFNQSGDTIPLGTSVPNATPKTSKDQSNIPFWNNPKNPSPNI